MVSLADGCLRECWPKELSFWEIFSGKWPRKCVYICRPTTTWDTGRSGGLFIGINLGLLPHHRETQLNDDYQ